MTCTNVVRVVEWRRKGKWPSTDCAILGKGKYGVFFPTRGTRVGDRHNLSYYIRFCQNYRIRARPCGSRPDNRVAVSMITAGRRTRIVCYRNPRGSCRDRQNVTSRDTCYGPTIADRKREFVTFFHGAVEFSRENDRSRARIDWAFTFTRQPYR